MKKIFFAVAILAIGLVTYSFKCDSSKTMDSNANSPKVEGGITWVTWEQAVELNKTKPKKFMIDVYTDWCGWCKRMDKDIFSDPKVAKYVADNYYAIKLDAEQKPDITFNGKTFKYVSQGRGGYHEFAAALLDNQMGYPTIVYLSEAYERTVVSPGYKDVPTLMKELSYTAENKYKTTTWDDFMKTK
jgi:thioredoxin-related protein